MIEHTPMKVRREFGRDGHRHIEESADVDYLYITDGDGRQWQIYAHHKGGLSVELIASPMGHVVLAPQSTHSFVVHRAMGSS